MISRTVSLNREWHEYICSHPQALGDTWHAFIDLKATLATDADYVPALYNLGGLFLSAHQWRRAMRFYDAAFSRDQRHLEARYNMAVALVFSRGTL